MSTDRTTGHVVLTISDHLGALAGKRFYRVGTHF